MAPIFRFVVQVLGGNLERVVDDLEDRVLLLFDTQTLGLGLALLERVQEPRPLRLGLRAADGDLAIRAFDIGIELLEGILFAQLAANDLSQDTLRPFVELPRFRRGHAVPVVLNLR